MGAYQPLHHRGRKPSSPGSIIHPVYFMPKAACTLLACAFVSLALLHLLFSFPAGVQEAVFSPLLQFLNVTSKQGACRKGKRCDYSEGQWVPAAGHARRYNGTECNVKDSENCIHNGRPDSGYLDWRWQPAGAGCQLLAFDAPAFLAAVRGRHVAFVGDSMARNQAESLVCLLGASFPYHLVYCDAEPRTRKFWRWAFPSHNVTVSVYWAPFLVRATGKSENYSLAYNSVFLGEFAERWSADADTMDVVVISTGHWFWNLSIFYNGSEVLGVHLLPKSNHTEIGFFSPYREAIRMSIERVISSGSRSGDRTAVVVTFSPAHFEKAWDDPTTCARKQPYMEGEKEVSGMEAALRTIVRDEVSSAAAARNGRGGAGARVEVLDVTKLATMRPDGHPGVYMHHNPFRRGVPERLQSDCLHFCLPGPVDTFNEILLQLLTKRR